MGSQRRVELSPRQTEVARLLCHGLTYAHVASRPAISERAVKADVYPLCARSGRKSTLAAVVDLGRLELV